MTTMRKWALVGALVAAASLTGCSSGGGSTDDTNNGGKSDAGNSNNNNNNNGTPAIEINAATGIDIIPDLAAKDEQSHASGIVLVQRKDKDDNDQPLNDAEVKLNGATLPALNIGGSRVDGEFDPAGATGLTGISPGSTLTLTASQGGQTSTLKLPCPADVQVTVSPTSAAEGDTVTVSWTGKISYNSPVLKPQVFVKGYNSMTNTIGIISVTTKNLQGNETSVMATVPTLRTGDGEDSWIVQLSVPGDYVTNSSDPSGGACFLAKRVKLAKK